MRGGSSQGLLVREWRLLTVRVHGRTGSQPPVNPRLRRLENDYRDLRLDFDADPNIVIQPIPPMPPEQYVITYRLPSLTLGPANTVQRTSQTTVILTLLSGYPREKPQATTSDPVFHPNFGAYVCIADFWSPGQSLSDIVRSIGDMLQFKKYNIRSPLNAIAAEWANANATSLPLSTVALGARGADLEISLGAAEAADDPMGGNPND